MIDFIRDFTTSTFGNACEGDTFMHNGDPFIATWDDNRKALVAVNLSTGMMVSLDTTERITPTDFFLEVKQT